MDAMKRLCWQNERTLFVSDEEVIVQICDLATTGEWTIYDIIDIYSVKKPEINIWELLQKILRSGQIRINARGIITV